MKRHIKIHGFVETIEKGRWYARLYIDNEELYAEMRDPLPSQAREGSLFTIHRTKNGKTYLYWITEPLIRKQQIYKAKQQARRWAKTSGKAFSAGDHPALIRECSSQVGGSGWYLMTITRYGPC